MGNNIGGRRRKRAKIMKIDGETFKLKTPAKASDVLKDYPGGYVLLEHEAVKRFGIRAQPLEPEEELKPKKIYFLVELPKFPNEMVPKRTRSSSSIGVSAKERLESLMLKQRSVSDIAVSGSSTGPVRVKMRLPRARIEKLMEESRDEVEIAEKIVDLCRQISGREEGRFRASGSGNWRGT